MTMIGRTTMLLFFQLLVIVVLIFIDQWTKYWAYTSLRSDGPIQVIDRIFQFTYVENRGAAFGMFQNQVMILAIFTSVIVIGIFVVLQRVPKIKKYIPLRAALLVLVAGAIGNLIDRVRLNFVIDFLYFQPIDFPVFNIADIYVVCSSIILMGLMLFVYKEEDLNFFKKASDKNE